VGVAATQQSLNHVGWRLLLPFLAAKSLSQCVKPFAQCLSPGYFGS